MLRQREFIHKLLGGRARFPGRGHFLCLPLDLPPSGAGKLG